MKIEDQGGFSDAKGIGLVPEHTFGINEVLRLSSE